MSIQCPITITFTPEGGSSSQLAGVEDFLARLPEFSGEQELYEPDGVKLGNAVFRPLGGAVWSVVIEVENPATLVSALSTHIDGGDHFGLLDVEGELVFTPADEEIPPTIFNPAVIRQIIPDLPSGDETILVTQYHILMTIPTL
jgi:hypothetical protein